MTYVRNFYLILNDQEKGMVLNFRVYGQILNHFTYVEIY